MLGRESLDFSFSGLKTALLYTLKKHGQAPFSHADLAASYQRAIVDALLARLEQAIDREGLDRVALGGGVAANRELRERAAQVAPRVCVPPMELCTDNAAMIAGAARFGTPIAHPGYLDLDAAARL
jgi:N6-L-threonylcarbamoyladenine synthase